MMVLRVKLAVLLMGIIYQCETMGSTDAFTNVGGSMQLMRVDEPMTFAEAERNCEKKGAKLVEMWNVEEWKEVMAWLKFEGKFYGLMSWIGLTDTKDEGTFIWRSGRTLSPNIPAPSTPTYPKLALNKKRHCVTMGQDWNIKRYCKDVSPSICQKRIAKEQELAGEEPTMTHIRDVQASQDEVKLNVIRALLYGVIIVLIFCILVLTIRNYMRNKWARPQDAVYLREID